MSIELKTKIRKFLESETQMSIDDDSANLIEKNILDSFIMIRLISFIEQELGVVIDMENLSPENFNSIAAIVKTTESWK